MKLVRYGEEEKEKPGLLDADGTIRDLSSVIRDIGGDLLSTVNLTMLRALHVAKLPSVHQDDVRFGACVANVGKLIGVGLNYRDHAEETGQPIPKEPVLFSKATSAICGANDDLILPKGSQKTDWEVELGVIIGSKAQYVSEEEALEYVAGYCTVNDVSEREYQFERGGQWFKGKSADRFAPLGPLLMTADEIADPQALIMQCEVSGIMMQNSTTANMIFSVKKLVSYISHFMTLLPGDVIATGTPAGVGFGRTPKRFLSAGDTLRVTVQGLGEQRQRVVAYPQ